jgi:hypothetical protein
MWGDISGKRTSLSFTVATGSRQRSHSFARVPRDSWPYFTVSDSRPPNLEGQVPVFLFPRTVWPFIPTGTGFPFRRFLRLAGLRWRYSNPPPHGLTPIKECYPLPLHSAAFQINVISEILICELQYLHRVGPSAAILHPFFSWASNHEEKTDAPPIKSGRSITRSDPAPTFSRGVQKQTEMRENEERWRKREG